MESLYKLNIVSESEVRRNIPYLCLNPHPAAMELLEKQMQKHEDRVDWYALSENPAAGHILKRNVTLIEWDQLSKNPCDDALDLLEANIGRVDWGVLATNTCDRAIRLLKANPDNINWFVLCGNPNPMAVEMIADLISTNEDDKVEWGELMSNPGAIEIIKNIYNGNLGEDRIARMDWEALSHNSHPDAIKILAKNMDKVNWANLSSNPCAIDLLMANPDKIVISMLACNVRAGDYMYEMIEKDGGVKDRLSGGIISRNHGMMRVLMAHREMVESSIWRNPGIFEYDYAAIYRRCNVYKEEMMERLAHPANAPCFGWLGWDEENVLGQEPRGQLIVTPEHLKM